MASEAIVSGVVADMVGRLMSLVAGQLRDRRGVEEKLRRVRRLLVRIESAVEAAEARRITGRALLAWLSELVDGAHQGRYFLDAFPVTDHEVDGGSGEVALANPLNPAKRLRVAARRLVFRDGGGGGGAAAELDGVLADLESVSGDLTGFITMLQSCPPALHRPLVTNIYADSQMFGRQVERRRVFDFLLQDGDDVGGEPAEAELGVLSIIGRMGLGKTTLVQNVCNDPEVRRRFQLIIELDFHCLSLMAAGETALLLRSMFIATGTGSATSPSGDGGETLSLLERKLRGVRFLAVFDNVDARRRRVIDAIMPALRRGRRGSKVIVTSRDAQHVAGLATTEPIALRPPPLPEYWFFFKAHAFAGADAEADPRLVAVGQAIAKRLRLAASFFGGKMLAALLRSRPDPRFWRTVLSSGAADLPCLGFDDAVAGSLFPPHVTFRSVTMSRSPDRGLVSLQDSSLTAPPMDSGHHRRSPELPVLLCKSVFPSYCLYYTAHCTINDTVTQTANCVLNQ
ncbi:putative disease resistance RPP13-like protein 3 [Oryza brachyantha]|uniref:putative disease resistance RPP13-like protein 3 n=1 Tax=Oryza brachyantha TaxID=4533 RepID=UPI001ADC56AF|nr:putative disease resistance RPP13-like protein 3 [Oryza brachyantha]